MVDIKEIKSVKLTPFTRMSASLNAILAFIVAVLLLIALVIMQVAGAMPQFGLFKVVAGFGIPLIVLLPVSAFFITLAASFFTAMLYNALVPRIGGVELGMDGDEVVRIPVISFALILAAIEAIWAFIVGLFLAAVITPITTLAGGIIPVLSSEIPKYLNTTNATLPAGPTGAPAGMEGAILAILLIIGLPIMVFVFGFIWQALFAVFYNYIATGVAKIKLEFRKGTENFYELKSIPVLPTALAVATVLAVFGLISGLLNSATYGPLYIIKDPVGNFIEYFIGTALIALIYNYLAPRIGSIKLNME